MKITWLDFDAAKKYSHKLQLNSQKEWKQFCKSGNKPDNIPVCPNRVYANEWVSWEDWLGTGNIAPQDREYLSFKEAREYVHGLNMKFLPFNEAREYVRNLNLKSKKDWMNYCKSKKDIDNIPSTPNRVYADQWTSWGDWLGT
jgi:hypothetical protein